MRTRLLAIDIDGTLLTRDRVPHPDNIVAVRRATEAGIRVVLASGRVAASMREFSDQLGLDGAMICSNGGHVQGLGGVELLHLGLAEEAVDITLKYADRLGIHVNAYTRNEIFFLSDSSWGEMYRRRVQSVQPKLSSSAEVRQMDVLKLILIDEPLKIPIHRAALEKLLSNHIASLTESEPEYLEVLSPAANKGFGLKVLSESLGIRQEETAAIGDYLNDLEMVTWAGIGAAVENAHEDVKEAADIVVPSNNDGGVARFIEYLLDR